MSFDVPTEDGKIECGIGLKSRTDENMKKKPYTEMVQFGDYRMSLEDFSNVVKIIFTGNSLGWPNGIPDCVRETIEYVSTRLDEGETPEIRALKKTEKV